MTARQHSRQSSGFRRRVAGALAGHQHGHRPAAVGHYYPVPASNPGDVAGKLVAQSANADGLFHARLSGHIYVVTIAAGSSGVNPYAASTAIAFALQAIAPAIRLRRGARPRRESSSIAARHAR